LHPEIIRKIPNFVLEFIQDPGLLFFFASQAFWCFFCVNFLFGVNFSALLRSSRNFFACTIKNLLVPVKEIIIEKFKN